MNKYEAKRWAHQFVAGLIENSPLPKMRGDDAAKVMRALNHMRETHARMGPRTGDKAPALPEYKGEKFSFDEVLALADEATDPGDQICRCKGRLPHAPGTIAPDGEYCAYTVHCPPITAKD